MCGASINRSRLSTPWAWPGLGGAELGWHVGAQIVSATDGRNHRAHWTRPKAKPSAETNVSPVLRSPTIHHASGEHVECQQSYGVAPRLLIDRSVENRPAGQGVRWVMLAPCSGLQIARHSLYWRITTGG